MTFMIENAGVAGVVFAVVVLPFAGSAVFVPPATVAVLVFCTTGSGIVFSGA